MSFRLIETGGLFFVPSASIVLFSRLCVRRIIASYAEQEWYRESQAFRLFDDGPVLFFRAEEETETHDRHNPDGTEALI